tara:strand:- start:123 stop:419 length:297 start_codon:yes stop_codon:yes gene_type:complete
MSGYKIINSDNEVINTINATLDFCEEAYPDHTYELVTTPELPAEVSERQWRDGELEATDKAAQTPDWPNRDNILLYRQALRDWPSTSDFPETRPVLGE